MSLSSEDLAMHHHLKQAYGSVDAVKATPLKVTTSQWALMTSFQFVYSLVCTQMGLFLLPMEAERLNKTHASLWLGAYLAACGSTQLVCPIAGKFSDRFRSRWGRRRPFIAVGSVFCIAGLVLMMVGSSLRLPWLFFLALFPAQLALNVVYAAQCGLPADLEERLGQSSSDVKGIVSGFLAVHAFLGALAAVALLASTRDMPMQIEYVFYVALLTIVSTLVCFVAPEAPSDSDDAVPQLRFSWADVRQSFVIDRRVDPDFFWVCVGRLFFYVNTSCSTFLFWYIRDTLGFHDEAAAKDRLAIVIVTAQLCGAAAAVPSSRLSTWVGRKPVIYGSCVIFCVAWSLYITAPVSGAYSWQVAQIASFAYGLGSGVYMSVDYALALDCLPTTKTSAESLGIWGVVGFCGSVIGPVCGGIILSYSGKQACLADSPELARYNYMGFVVIMSVLGMGMCVLTALATMQINFNKPVLLD